LLIEDYEIVLRYLCDAVQTVGHTAHCVKTKAEAEAALSSGGFDLVICNVLLPDGSGTDVAARAADMGIKTILMTGHPDSITALTIDDIAHLRKPFRLEDLMKLIQDNLGAGQSEVSGS
jgi:DNA-binding NtrC family response regulator